MIGRKTEDVSSGIVMMYLAVGDRTNEFDVVTDTERIRFCTKIVLKGATSDEI
jgi:hypothetical protein